MVSEFILNFVWNLMVTPIFTLILEFVYVQLYRAQQCLNRGQYPAVRGHFSLFLRYDIHDLHVFNLVPSHVSNKGQNPPVGFRLFT